MMQILNEMKMVKVTEKRLQSSPSPKNKIFLRIPGKNFQDLSIELYFYFKDSLAFAAFDRKWT